MDISHIALTLFIGIPFLILFGGFLLILLKIERDSSSRRTALEYQELWSALKKLEVRIAGLEKGLAFPEESSRDSTENEGQSLDE